MFTSQALFKSTSI